MSWISGIEALWTIGNFDIAADVGVPAELITAARAVNRTMPLHVATVLIEKSSVLE